MRMVEICAPSTGLLVILEIREFTKLQYGRRRFEQRTQRSAPSCSNYALCMCPEVPRSLVLIGGRMLTNDD